MQHPVFQLLVYLFLSLPLDALDRARQQPQVSGDIRGQAAPPHDRVQRTEWPPEVVVPELRPLQTLIVHRLLVFLRHSSRAPFIRYFRTIYRRLSWYPIKINIYIYLKRPEKTSCFQHRKRTQRANKEVLSALKWCKCVKSAPPLTAVYFDCTELSSIGSKSLQESHKETRQLMLNLWALSLPL